MVQFTGSQYRRQHTRDRTQLSAKAQFTEILSRQVEARRPQLAGCREYAQRDRKIKTAALLGKIGGSQVNGNPARGKIEA